jgi:hypothetical protein
MTPRQVKRQILYEGGADPSPGKRAYARRAWWRLWAAWMGWPA